MAKEARGITVIIVVVIILAAGLAVYLLTSRVKSCSDIACFNSAMEKCSKTSVINDASDATWQYTIKGKSNGECIVNVLLLQLKKGTVDILDIEGLDMDCSLPLGYSGNPQKDLSRCHGQLREGMQDIIIKKMHSYILENIGEISEELTKIQ